MAEAEAEVTLRELQEALEEEVLTRQSLSREMEAIRIANQNFARSALGPGRGARGPWQPLAASLVRLGLTHRPYLPTVNYARQRLGTGT